MYINEVRIPNFSEVMSFIVREDSLQKKYEACCYAYNMYIQLTNIARYTSNYDLVRWLFQQASVAMGTMWAYSDSIKHLKKGN